MSVEGSSKEQVSQAPEPTSYVVEGETYRKLIAERDAYKSIANDLARQLRKRTPADTNVPPERASNEPCARRRPTLEESNAWASAEEERDWWRAYAMELERAAPPPAADAVAMARRFHEAYERLAPLYGYETRTDTRAFDPDSKNGQLMTAVCMELFGLPMPRLPQMIAQQAERIRNGLDERYSTATKEVKP